MSLTKKQIADLKKYGNGLISEAVGTIAGGVFFWLDREDSALRLATSPTNPAINDKIIARTTDEITYDEALAIVETEVAIARLTA